MTKKWHYYKCQVRVQNLATVFLTSDQKLWTREDTHTSHYHQVGDSHQLGVDVMQMKIQMFLIAQFMVICWIWQMMTFKHAFVDWTSIVGLAYGTVKLPDLIRHDYLLEDNRLLYNVVKK